MQLREATHLFQKTTQGFEGFWCVAGGWAIDLFLGKQTREHEDLEIVVLREEQTELFQHFHRFSPKKIVTKENGQEPDFELWEGGAIEPNVIQLRLDPNLLGTSQTEFDLLLTPSGNGNWICRRDESIQLPLKKTRGFTEEGVPYLAPEIVLLFKAKYVRDKDAGDFENCLPNLIQGQKSWLRQCLEKIHPKHNWLARL